MPEAVVIGAGPAGLMAAEVLAAAGVCVDVFDTMPSVGRKLLMAGKGGLNLTHSEPADVFLTRYGERRAQIAPWLREFDARALRQWASGLGVDTFIGSSGRVFPAEMKAAPLLRKWLHRLRESGVRFHVRHRWCGWTDDGALRFTHPKGELLLRADAVVLALGGGSWARLGSDGAWTKLLTHRGIDVVALQPANCGFDVGWSEHFRSKFAGCPLKSIAVSLIDAGGHVHARFGECVITDTGIEGGLVYALSALLRDLINARGEAVIRIDLLPDRTPAQVCREIAHARGSRSLSSHLKSRLGISGVKSGLLREVLPAQTFNDVSQLAAAIKSLPLRLAATRPIDEAISTAGGVSFDAVDAHLMLRALPGVFCAGEMLDWEAPTGGYLLTACFASGRVAAAGAQAWLSRRVPPPHALPPVAA